MKNSEIFLEAFSAIETFLRNLTRLDRGSTFYQLVETGADKSSIVLRLKDDLKELADLRNAIVHERSGGYIIAEPNEKAIELIERIRDLLIKPPGVYPDFKAEVTSFEAQASISKAVKIMAKKEFSQVPITEDGAFKALLTTNTIARWLGFMVDEDIVSLEETKINEVLNYSEDIENFKFIAKNVSIFELINIFHKFQSKGKRLEAALITDRGKPCEKIIGIVTVADFPKILKKIGL